jgi:hypothetical protein
VSEPKFIIEEVTDPAEIARHRNCMEKFSRNSDWLETHWSDVLPQAHGRFIAVAGQEAFVADTLEQALSQAKAAHPDDEGLLVQYVFPPGGLTIALEFTRDDGSTARVRGEFAAFTEASASDLSILGRDVLDNFDVITSRRRNAVLLLAGNHRYEVMSS